ncbi:BA3454 family stress response protein [Bacillus sp. J33]|nr:BA3454 family stress response protein [Bacillus sp. J33]
MKEITVTIDYDGMKYQTNIITKKEVKEEEVIKKAEEQVRKQWAG